MKNRHWYWIWGGLFILCALLGFIPEPSGFVKFLLLLAATAFFVPGAALLYRAQKLRDASTFRVVLSISLTSLAATLLFLILNLASGSANEAAGQLLYGFLVIFSTPMICSQYWAVSLFLWACLLMVSLSQLRKTKKMKKT